MLHLATISPPATRHLGSPRPRRSSWNTTVEELFPYLGLEEGGHMVGLLRQEQVLIVKERDLDIRDVMARAPSKRKGAGEDRGKRKGKRREEEEEEEREEVWPLPPLLGCPREGVLTVEGGAAHLGTLMTQVSLD